MIKHLFTLLLSLFFVCDGFSEQQIKPASFKPVPTWLNNAVFYQIYPQSFKDTDGDGVGDLKGIIEKADYIKSLGVDAVWFNPINPSPFNDAGYDVSDYYGIAPRYGTMDDFRKLLSELKKRNIRVILDLVAGHTSTEHQWFKESAKAGKNAYTDRYIWTKSRDVKPERFVDGSKYERAGNYLKNFFDSQPALNYGYAVPDPANSWEMPVSASGPQKTKEELRNIMKFWLDMGVSGFRVDMASSLIKNDVTGKEIRKLWQDYRTWMEKNYPESVLIAEWGNPSEAIPAGFHVDFLIHFGKTEYPSLFFNEAGVFKKQNCFFDKQGKGTVTKFVNNYLEHKANIGNRGYISVPTANHDFQRPACANRKGDDLKVAM
ncbi:MAG: alpha-amylase family glycosyl hydrolase, partial [Bacteroidales bacterium]|nr:alpha-amylase family glycosyl hydrolase [Bacteroidales bacterium]